MSDQSWYIYMLHCADGSLYTGITRDVPGRLDRHNDGRAAKYTRGRLPVRLVYVEKAADRSAALRREYRIKRMDSNSKRQLIRESSPTDALSTGVTQ